MATGDLSPDEARYAALVAAGTGLAPQVVTAWIGSESGWGITKAGHNYLNIGPGRTYPSTEHAATAAAALVNSSSHYAGIRAAIPAGGAAQIHAIGASPWGTSAAVLARVYAQLTGGAGPAVTPVGLRVPGTPIVIPTSPSEALDAIGDAAGSVLDTAGNVVGAAADPVIDAISTGFGVAVDVFLKGAMSLVFATAAFALIALGLNRLTGVPVKERFGQVQQIAGQAAMAAAVL